MTKAGNLAIPGLQSAKSDSLGVLSGSLFSGGFRSLGSGNLGCGFGFLHHGLLRAHRLGDELDDGCRSGIAATRLEAIGLGEHFLADEADPKSAANRRVEFQATS